MEKGFPEKMPIFKATGSGEYRVKRICLVFLITIIMFSLVSCDHTQLTGEVDIPDTKIEVGNKIPLVLVVPEELSGIYRTMWAVEPEEKGDIIYGEELLDTLTEEEMTAYFGSGKESLNADRIALFIPKEIGECTILVDGFYKQTNPQKITSIDIKIQ